MPINKPTKVPQWATDGDALITEPSSGKKGTGWTAPSGVGEKPRLQYFNWLLNINYLWAKWLNDQLNSGGSWIRLQAFNTGLIGTATDHTDVNDPSVPGAELVGSADRSPLRVRPMAATTGGHDDDGDVYVDQADNNAKVMLNSVWRAVVAGTPALVKTQADGGTREDAHVVNAYGGSAPVFGAGWLSEASSGGHNLNPVGYWKDAFGVVHFQGAAGRSTTNPGGGTVSLVAFTLPAGYRPANRVMICSCLLDVTYGSAAVVYVDTDGSVTITDNITRGSDYAITLEGLSFVATQ